MLNTTRLVNNLLDMARISPAALICMVADAGGSGRQRAAHARAKPRRPAYSAGFTRSLQLVHVDGPLFERVLINLLENAHKYAGARASIGIRAEADARQLSLEVWDNGPGSAGRGADYL